MPEFVQVSASTTQAKALVLGNSQNTSWTSTIVPQLAIPSGDGVYSCGHGGGDCYTFLKLMPYCIATVGQQFSMRLYAWDVVAVGPQSQNTSLTVHVPTLIAEFLCTAAYIPGPVIGVTATPSAGILAQETFCDTITLTQGTVGGGLINSTGPGTNLVAWAKVELFGCRYYQFDFSQSDTMVAPVEMNCLWSRC